MSDSVRYAQASDREELVPMRLLLWPNASIEKHRQELDLTLSRQSVPALPTATLVSLDQIGALTGFLEVSLRSHADGCDTARSVGFVEGWFVREPFRRQGIGKVLMKAAEDWAREQGCSEMASDALVDNRLSQDAHAALGFEVVDRCVHFRKAL
jgi:aminoglycoside 6'-N-acetyltransferase I